MIFRVFSFPSSASLVRMQFSVSIHPCHWPQLQQTSLSLATVPRFCWCFKVRAVNGTGFRFEPKAFGGNSDVHCTIRYQPTISSYISNLSSNCKMFVYHHSVKNFGVNKNKHAEATKLKTTTFNWESSGLLGGPVPQLFRPLDPLRMLKHCRLQFPDLFAHSSSCSC